MTRAVLVVAALLAGCGLDRRLPPTAAERAQAAERVAGARLARQLEHLPGVAAASALVVLPVDDPLAPTTDRPPRAAITVVALPAAAPALVEASHAAARALLGEAATIEVTTVPVAASSAGPGRARRRAWALVALMIGAAAVAVGLAMARRRAVVRYRGIRPHQSRSSTTRGS
ncbi:MAG: hypothetical protein R3B06_18325 [Kofleriaceae bacterium]